MHRRRTVLALCVTTLLVSRTGTETVGRDEGPPYSPEQSMTTMQIERGFRIDLVTSEPDVQSPVAMDIDENGRMFVVEMPGYPLDVSPTGRVKLLEDTDGDGRFERVTVFADSLVLPTGVMRWKQGVLVTAAPDVLYFEDTDGDGRADIRRVVLTGFPRTNPQHTVNAPIYGLDNWIYVANQGPVGAIIYKDLFGDRGTRLTFPDRPKQPGIDPHDSTVRFRPDTFEAEAIAGESQFGHTFDAYGRYFGNDNSHHLWHEVIAARYLRRNPHLLVGRVMRDVPDHGAAAAVFPITRRPTFELLTEAGEFTSACAPIVYLGGAFPGQETSVFVAEPVHNLVHRDLLSPSGASFTARRAERQREFLAAGDAWFRPVNFHVGPDGALYVVDYYRGRIEHPEWTDTEAQRNPSGFYEGHDRGRIYRITHDSTAAQRRPPRLGTASGSALVAVLDDPNAWWRRTAQRLLVDRGDRSVVPALEALVRERRSALGRLHALWTLHGMGALDAPLIASAMTDPDAGIRENAIILAELNGRVANLDEQLAAMTSDPDPRVRFQVLATLGGLSTPVAIEAHERLLLAHLEDPWMPLAGLSADSDRAARLVRRALDGEHTVTDRETEGRALFIRRASAVIGARSKAAEIDALIAIATTAPASSDKAPEAWWRAAALQGLADGAGGRETAEAALASSRTRLLASVESSSPAVRRGALRLITLAGGVGKGDAARRVLASAAYVAADGNADAERRADAVRLLALGASKKHRALLQSLLDPQQPEPLQVAAVAALGTLHGDTVAPFLLARWPGLTAAVRHEAADALLKDTNRTRQLVEALRSGRVPRWTLTFSQKRALLMNRDEDIRDRSRAILEEDPRRRQETVERYAAALDLAGDPDRGAQVFGRACAMCHAIGGTGGDLGPDLATVRHRPSLMLLTDILLPSQAIAQRYETYVLERVSGATVTGVMSAQTPTSITLGQGPGQQITVARRDIRKLTASPQSSMPADLDRVVTPGEMADLLAYIRRP
jgi:putative membrane-bound dehydrogenase-like protein